MTKRILLSLCLFCGIISGYSQTQHTISKGETFESIASQYGVTVESIRQANPRLKNCIVGFKITIPSSSTSNKQTPTSPTEKRNSSSTPSAVTPSTSAKGKTQSSSPATSAGKISYSASAKNDYEFWKEHYNKDAGKALERAAQGGHPEAMAEYGRQLLSGSKAYGIKKNKQKGAEWINKAASLGSGTAMYYIYVNGYEKEFGNLSSSSRNEWLEKAFANGSSDAAASKAEDFLKGKNGCPKNLAKAAELYDLAFSRGREYGSYDTMRECAGNLPGTKANAVKKAQSYESEGKGAAAAFWYMKAGLDGDANSMIKVAELCKERKLSGGYNAPFEWYRKAAQAGNSKAMYELATLYQNGSGGANIDKKEAFNWYKKSYEAGNNEAILKIAESYSKGNGVSQNYNEAKKWYSLAEKKNIKGGAEGIAAVDRSQKAAEVSAQKQKEREAIQNAYQSALTQFSQNDYDSAYPNFKKAADGGIKDSYYYLGQCYEHGYGTPQNLVQARTWYKKASDSGDVRAMYLTGVFYENGIGGERNQFTASFYYGMGMGKGDSLCTNAVMLANRGVRNLYTVPPSHHAIASSMRNSGNSSTSAGSPTYTPSTTYSPPSTYTPSYTPSYIEQEPKRVERREVPCTWCNGTGLVLKKLSCPVAVFHDCVEIYCQQCSKSHCKSNTYHEKCPRCEGARTISEKKVDGRWIRDYGF